MVRNFRGHAIADPYSYIVLQSWGCFEAARKLLCQCTVAKRSESSGYFLDERISVVVIRACNTKSPVKEG